MSLRVALRKTFCNPQTLSYKDAFKGYPRSHETIFIFYKKDDKFNLNLLYEVFLPKKDKQGEICIICITKNRKDSSPDF